MHANRRLRGSEAILGNDLGSSVRVTEDLTGWLKSLLEISDGARLGSKAGIRGVVFWKHSLGECEQHFILIC